jgi:hypothetical protein
MSTIFTLPDKRLLNNSYFSVIRSCDDFFEIKSNNTGHCWIINKVISKTSFPITLYHKHNIKEAYYHLQSDKCSTVRSALDIIYQHDEYILNKGAQC